MNADERRAAAFGRWFDQRMCTRIEPWRWGTAYVDDDFPLCPDTNFLLIEGRPADITVDGIVGEAERTFERAGPLPLRVVVDEMALARHLEPGFRDLGWEVERFLLMVHRRRVPSPRGLPPAEEQAMAGIRPLLEEVMRRGSEVKDEDTTRMLVDYRAKVERRVGTRFFAAPMDGRLAGVCELYLDGTDAQIDLVNTLEEARGRGIGTSVVLKAVDAACEAGARWIHLCTDAADWPQHWYRRLGFNDAGGVVSSVRASR